MKYDDSILPTLAKAIASKTPRNRHDSVAKRYGKPWPRDWRHVAYRWLRRFVGGQWHVGGHHVGRFNFGAAIGEMRFDKRSTVALIRGAKEVAS